MKNMNIISKLKKTKSYLAGYVRNKPEVCIISGSGLGNIKNSIKISSVISYSKIPYFKKTTVKGHNGELVFGKLNGVNTVLMNGRWHHYEGNSMQEIIYPVRLMKELGVKNIIITFAAGAINKKYKPGDIVVLKDHINFMSDNPLTGEHFDCFGERFPDMGSAYDKKLRQTVLKSAKRLDITVCESVYFAVKGPSYETPAEINAFRILGGDVVGMSVVPEAIAAAQMNMKILSIGYISNQASGLSDKKLEHKKVLESGTKAGFAIASIIYDVIKVLQ